MDRTTTTTTTRAIGDPLPSVTAPFRPRPAAASGRAPSIRELSPPPGVLSEPSWGRDLAEEAFFDGGLHRLVSSRLDPRPGVNAADALAHVKAVLGSFGPPHRDKMAVAGALLELWFEPRQGPPAAASPWWRGRRAALATAALACWWASLAFVPMKALGLAVVVAWGLYELRALAFKDAPGGRQTWV